MSKKTRKKSPKSSPAKASRAAAAKSTKKSAAKTRSAAPKKAAKKAVKKAAKQTAVKTTTTAAKRPAAATSKGSHKPATKQLKSSTSPSKPTAKAALTEGMKAPAFHLPRDGGSNVSLADFAGQKLVLFFYPRADTPGCTKEAIDFTRLRDAFAASKTAIVGVSADPLKAQESFRNKHKLETPLASDEKHEMLEAYGAWGEKSMYGKTFLGVLRTTVLIGEDGKVLKIWRGVKVDGHADEVLNAAKEA